VRRRRRKKKKKKKKRRKRKSQEEIIEMKETEEPDLDILRRFDWLKARGRTLCCEEEGNEKNGQAGKVAQDFLTAKIKRKE